MNALARRGVKPRGGQCAIAASLLPSARHLHLLNAVPWSFYPVSTIRQSSGDKQPCYNRHRLQCGTTISLPQL